jgi:hypothetical protein
MQKIDIKSIVETNLKYQSEKNSKEYWEKCRALCGNILNE